MPRAKSILLLAGSVSILGLSLLLIPTTPERSVERVLVAEEDAPARPELVLPPLEVEERVPSPGRETATEPEPVSLGRLDLSGFQLQPVAALRARPLSTEYGRLQIRAIDAETRQPLQGVRVRAMSAARLADRQVDPGAGWIELTLTPDTYSVLVQSKGYEPLELGLVRINADETVSLEPSGLRTGNARILGVVNGLDVDRTLDVELLGDGRHPCAKCADEPNEGESLPVGPIDAWRRKSPCSECGYTAAFTRMTLSGSGAFTFDRLASGAYALRLTEGGRALGLPTYVELRAGETASVVMEALRTRTVELELLDTDGTSLAAEWSRRVGARTQVEDPADRFLGDSFHFPIAEGPPPLEFECQFRADEVHVASASILSPYEGTRGWTYVMSCGIGDFAPYAENHDRPLADSESLRPDPHKPEVELIQVDPDLDADGLVLFERVPSMALTLEITSGPFTANVSVPASRETIRVSARLTRSGSSTDSDESEAKRSAKTFLEYEAIHDREGKR